MQNIDFYDEKELFNPIKLCDNVGNLNDESIGWSRHQIYECNLSKRWLRKKKWNYWSIANDHCLFSVTISNFDYAGMVFMYFYDFSTKQFIEKTYLTPLGKGCTMSQTVSDSITFSHPKVDIAMMKENSNTHITVNCKDFGGTPLHADFLVLYPDNYDTLNVVIPWKQNTFQFTSKHQGMSIDGFIKLDNKTYHLKPDSAFGCLDYGRGIWPRNISWNWAYVSGIADGRRIGINLGAKWTANTGMTENAIVIDGKLTKFSEDVDFKYDKNNFMKPWKIKTTLTDRINLTFHPEYERIANSNIVLVKSELHQMIGYVSGTIKTDDNKIIELEELIGCTEDHYTKW